MSISKGHLSYHERPVLFDVEALGNSLKQACPEALFALLLGSARKGVAEPGSDIDIALFVKGKPTFDISGSVARVVEEYAPGVHCDIGYLNGAEPVYRYESLKGYLLFKRDDEAYYRFYSVACREYEHQVFHYEKQFQYRIQRHESEAV